MDKYSTETIPPIRNMDDLKYVWDHNFGLMHRFQNDQVEFNDWTEKMTLEHAGRLDKIEEMLKNIKTSDHNLRALIFAGGLIYATHRIRKLEAKVSAMNEPAPKRIIPRYN